jgi:hypothetical protein
LEHGVLDDREGTILLVSLYKYKIVSCHTADSKPVKEEVNGTVILLPYYSLLIRTKEKHSSLFSAASVTWKKGFMNSVQLDIFANAVTPQEYLTGEPMKFKSVCKFKIVCEDLQVDAI